MDYMCKHVKQLVLETHHGKPGRSGWWPGEYGKGNNLPTSEEEMWHANELMRRLEKCFRLTIRFTRWFEENGYDKTEFMDPKKFRIHTSDYSNEMHLINFMVTFGEMSFINQMFVG